MITYEEIKINPTIREYITQADKTLLACGYTEHGFAHVGRVAYVAEQILQSLGYSQKECELVKTAAWLHDIGNLINRDGHAQSGALMAFRILEELGMPPADISAVVRAIGNHDEKDGIPLDPITAALILADKSDVRRTRVRNNEPTSFDIHDRVNYSVTKSEYSIETVEKKITLHLTIETAHSAIMDYFEIFLTRMIMCRRASEKLGLKFALVINDQCLL